MALDNARYRPGTDPFYQSAAAPDPVTAPAGAVVSPDTLRQVRLPPGQVRTRKWPVLQAAKIPEVAANDWSIHIDGLVERPLTLTWREFSRLPRVQVFADFHCVTRWSRLGNFWEGVSAAAIAEIVGVCAEAQFVIVEGFDAGWATNLPLSDFVGDDVLLADRHDHRSLTAPHGGPVRLIVPRLYAWKSAKWVRRITFVADDRPGYWERLGYHDRGDPWSEERFR